MGAAALPGVAGLDRADRVHQAGMGVGDDELDDRQAAGDQRTQEGEPAGEPGSAASTAFASSTVSGIGSAPEPSQEYTGQPAVALETAATLRVTMSDMPHSPNAWGTSSAERGARRVRRKPSNRAAVKPSRDAKHLSQRHGGLSVAYPARTPPPHWISGHTEDAQSALSWGARNSKQSEEIVHHVIEQGDEIVEWRGEMAVDGHA